VNAEVAVRAEGQQVHIESDRFLYGVHFDAPGFEPDDNWFHLVPGRRKTISLRRSSSVPRSSSGASAPVPEELRGTRGTEEPRLRGTVEALNLA